MSKTRTKTATKPRHRTTTAAERAARSTTPTASEILQSCALVLDRYLAHRCLSRDDLRAILDSLDSLDELFLTIDASGERLTHDGLRALAALIALRLERLSQ